MILRRHENKGLKRVEYKLLNETQNIIWLHILTVHMGKLRLHGIRGILFSHHDINKKKQLIKENSMVN